MAQLTLFNRTDNNTLVGGQSSTQVIDPSTLPLFFGDTLQLTIYLLQTPIGYNATDPSNSKLQTVPVNGLSLFLYLDNGIATAPTIYTQQINFNVDLINNLWTGTLALNTAALQSLLGSATTASCWLKMGYVQGGLQTTTLSKLVNIAVGLPQTNLVVPPGLTPLSAEVALATFVPLNPVAGQPIFLRSKLGKLMQLTADDQPDGTVSAGWSNIG